MAKFAILFAVCAALLCSAPAFAVDGQVLISQATVMASGGFPYKITQAGSYKLSSNLVVPSNADGIDVLASNVTIDLNGFSIIGPITCTSPNSPPKITCENGGGSATRGVFNTESLSYLATTLKNGSVSGFEIAVEISTGIVDGVKATNNAQGGISGYSSTIKNCTAYLNGGIGVGGSNSVITDNAASFNLVGVSGEESTISENTAISNSSDGIDSFSSTAVNNVANFNGRFGLFATGGVYGSNTILDNTTAPVEIESGAISQKNNFCGTGSAC